MGKLSKVLLVLIALLTIVTGRVVFASGPVEFEFKTIDNLCGHTLIGDIDGDNRNDIIMHCRHDNFDNHLAWFRYPDMTKYTIKHGDYFGDRFAVGDMAAFVKIDPVISS